MNSGKYVVISNRLTVPLEAAMLSADRRLAVQAQRRSAADARRTRRSAEVGWKGETLEEAMARIAAANRRNRDHDTADEWLRPRSMASRSGW